MIAIEDLRDWRGTAVITQDGAKIGSLEAVYFDTATQEPAFVSVRVGLPISAKLVFVPLTDATVAPKHLRVSGGQEGGPSRTIHRGGRRVGGRRRTGRLRALRHAVPNRIQRRTSPGSALTRHHRRTRVRLLKSSGSARA